MNEIEVVNQQNVTGINFKENDKSVKIYANVSEMSLTLEEGILRLGVKNIRDVENAEVVATVFLSIAHTKRIALGLNKLIKQYEELVGPIEENPRPINVPEDQAVEEVK